MLCIHVVIHHSMVNAVVTASLFTDKYPTIAGILSLKWSKSVDFITILALKPCISRLYLIGKIAINHHNSIVLTNKTSIITPLGISLYTVYYIK